MSEKPADAPEACPGGPGSEMAGKASACEGCPSRNICATAPKGPDPDIAAIAKCLQGNIKFQIDPITNKLSVF